MRIDPGFARLFHPDLLDAAEAERGAAFGIWPDGRLAMQNSAWDAFAWANDGLDVIARWPLGSSLWTAVPEPLRAFYMARFEDVAVEEVPFEHEYECPSPTNRRR